MRAKKDDLCGGQRATEVKYSKQCSISTKLGQKNCCCWCKFRKMMTYWSLMEVKGQQRSNLVNYAMWLLNFVKRSLMMIIPSYSIGVRGQRSTEVKCGKICPMATTFGQKYHSFKLRLMMTFKEVTNHYKGWPTSRSWTYIKHVTIDRSLKFLSSVDGLIAHLIDR